MALGEAGSAYGSVVVDGIRKSLRLNPTLRNAVLTNASAVEEAAAGVDVPEEAMAYLPIDLVTPAPSGGRRGRMRGGALTQQQKEGIAALSTAALITMAAAYFTGIHEIVVGAGAAGIGLAGIVNAVGTERAGAAGRAIGKYLESRGAGRVGESFGVLGTKFIDTADRTLALSFAAARLPIAGGTAVVGTLGRLIDRGAAAIQKAADKLESPATHNEQADLIIENGTLAFAAALAALTASGALPLMTIFSVMLWSGKLYASPAGRALAIVELYIWWINKTKAEKDVIGKEVKEYVAAAKTGGAAAKSWVERTGAPKMREAFEYVAPKIKKTAAAFVAGLEEGAAMENPVAASLSLAFVRAMGLDVDPAAPEPKVESGESKDSLLALAENILKDAFPPGRPVDTAELEVAIRKLKDIRRGAESVAAMRAQLVEAKAELKSALEAAGVGSLPIAPAPGAAGPAAAGAPAPGAAPRRRAPLTGGPAPVPAPGAAAAGEAAAGPAPGTKRGVEAPERRSTRARKAEGPAAVGATGGRRKTRRKRLVRRVTKKVKGFYY
jgi:hypothetical protein